MDQTSEIDIDAFLEREHQHNKTEGWNKLHKTTKTQKLHAFAEKYGHTNHYSAKEVRQLKLFLSDALDKKKLNKVKEINYNKIKGEITEIPGLLFNATTNQYTLRADTKRVSTLSSLTPKNMTHKAHKTDKGEKDQVDKDKGDQVDKDKGDKDQVDKTQEEKSSSPEKNQKIDPDP